MKLLRHIFAFREFILVALLFITIEKLVSGRQLSSYLNPDFFRFVSLALVVLCFLLISSLFISVDREPEDFKKTGITKYILFIAVIVLINIPPDPAAFNAHMAGSAGMFHGLPVNNNATPGTPERRTPFINDKPEPVIEITKSRYYYYVNDIYEHPERYTGKKFTIDGFVYVSSKLGSKEFIIARLIIYCCAADAGIGGLICDRSSVAGTVKKDEWLRVSGTLQMKKKEGDKPVPVLMLDSLKKIAPDREPYIYPVY